MPYWLVWIWRAWHALHPERVMVLSGFAAPMGGMMLRSIPGRIPWTAIRSWSEHHGHGPEEMEMLTQLLHAMDDEYLSWWQARNGDGR